MGLIDKNLRQLMECQLDDRPGSAIDMRIESQDGVTIMNYLNVVPPFAEALLDRLYKNLFSSLAHFRIYDGIAGIHTYVACREEQILALLLYRVDGGQVKVLNEGSRLPAEEVDRFARHVFKCFPAIRAVSLHAVSFDGTTTQFPLQRFNCLEDIVLPLPPATQDYLASLGKSTRSYLNRYQNKLKRDFPSLSHAVYAQHEIKEEHINEILELNRFRMEGKGRLTPWTPRDRQCLLELARICGMVCVIKINDRICAGTINYRVEDNYFLQVIAHAPEYDEYRLGTLCCFATICRCIAQGGQEYHFLWGRSDYKFRLGGVQRDLEHVAIFRSRFQMLMNARMVFGNVYRCYDRKARLWAKETRQVGSPSGRRLGGAIRLLDAIRLALKRQKHRWLEPASKYAASVKGNLRT